MKRFYLKTLLSFLAILLSQFGYGQEKNIEVEKLHSDKNCSSFEISIRDSVRLHYHAEHTEHIFVLEGKAKMKIDDSVNEIKSGDHFVIPAGSKHAVWVLSDTPLKVISIQSPEFNGQDRNFVDE